MTVASTMTAMTSTRTFQADPAQIPVLDDWIEGVMAAWGASQRTAFAARLCVAEIVTNTIEHGGVRRDGDIAVTLRRDDGGVDIEIADTGRAFDPTAAALAPLPSSVETAEAGGLGIRLVRTYARDITYRSDDTGNRLRLRIPGTPA